MLDHNYFIIDRRSNMKEFMKFEENIHLSNRDLYQKLKSKWRLHENIPLEDLLKLLMFQLYIYWWRWDVKIIQLLFLKIQSNTCQIYRMKLFLEWTKQIFLHISTMQHIKYLFMYLSSLMRIFVIIDQWSCFNIIILPCSSV